MSDKDKIKASQNIRTALYERWKGVKESAESARKEVSHWQGFQHLRECLVLEVRLKAFDGVSDFNQDFMKAATIKAYGDFLRTEMPKSSTHDRASEYGANLEAKREMCRLLTRLTLRHYPEAFTEMEIELLKGVGLLNL